MRNPSEPEKHIPPADSSQSERLAEFDAAKPEFDAVTEECIREIDELPLDYLLDPGAEAVAARAAEAIVEIQRSRNRQS